MARRKDHTPDELKALILQSAEKIINTKGLEKLTARALALAVGYTPGTIYNLYKDMDAVVLDINFITLGRLHAFCQTRVQGMQPGFKKVKALAYAYVDFAHQNVRAWETLFAYTHKGKTRPPKPYQQRVQDLFQLIAATLQECLKMPQAEAASSARLLWSCLHGITVLMLDGRINLVGVEQPHTMIDDLLEKYLATYA
jgi:AcrR family transcriptional regulator